MSLRQAVFKDSTSLLQQVNVRAVILPVKHVLGRTTLTVLPVTQHRYYRTTNASINAQMELM